MDNQKTNVMKKIIKNNVQQYQLIDNLLVDNNQFVTRVSRLDYQLFMLRKFEAENNKFKRIIIFGFLEQILVNCNLLIFNQLIKIIENIDQNSASKYEFSADSFATNKKKFAGQLNKLFDLYYQTFQEKKFVYDFLYYVVNNDKNFDLFMIITLEVLFSKKFEIINKINGYKNNLNLNVFLNNIFLKDKQWLSEKKYDDYSNYFSAFQLHFQKKNNEKYVFGNGGLIINISVQDNNIYLQYQQESVKRFNYFGVNNNFKLENIPDYKKLDTDNINDINEELNTIDSQFYFSISDNLQVVNNDKVKNIVAEINTIQQQISNQTQKYDNEQQQNHNKNEEELEKIQNEQNQKQNEQNNLILNLQADVDKQQEKLQQVQHVCEELEEQISQFNKQINFIEKQNSQFNIENQELIKKKQQIQNSLVTLPQQRRQFIDHVQNFVITNFQQTNNENILDDIFNDDIKKYLQYDSQFAINYLNNFAELLNFQI